MPDQDERWIVFWCSLLGPILLEQVPAGERRRFLKELSQKEILLPNGTRKRISLSTLRRKVRRFRLMASTGCGGSLARTMAGRKNREVIVARAIELKREQPFRSPAAINEFLKQEFGRTIPRSTMMRHLRQAGATRRNLRVSPAKKTLRSKIESIPAADRQQLQQWRDSSNKRLWEKAVTILNSCDSTLEEICAKTERSRASIYRWIRLYNKYGVEGLKRKSRDRSKSNEKLQVKTRRVLELLHDRPESYGINRSNWTLRSLAMAYEERHGVEMNRSTVDWDFFNLGFLAEKLLGKRIKRYNDIVRKDQTFLDLPFKEMKDHGCQDADFALQLYEHLDKRAEKKGDP